MRFFLLALLIIPAIEIGIFIWIGNIIGPLWVVSLIVLTGLLGIILAKRLGMQTWLQAKEMTQRGQVPSAQIFDGLCIFIGAILLIAPGFITDLIGLLLIIPFTRKPFKVIIQNIMKYMIGKRMITFRRRL